MSFLGLLINKGPQTGWLKATDIHCLTVLEARSPGLSKAMLPLKPLGEGLSLHLPSFWWCLSVLGVSWLATASLQPLTL